MALAFITVLLGLASRSNTFPLPSFISTYAGDTLWAMLVFWLVRAISFNIKISTSAVIAISFSFTIEFLQFYHAPWIESIRSTLLGGLVLGYGFKASDLLCYSIGIGLGYSLDVLLFSKLKQR